MINFGKIKIAFNELLLESKINNDLDKRNLFKKYLNEIRTNKILGTQFYVYSNIESEYLEDIVEAKNFISDNISFIKNYGIKKIIKENNKLVNLLGKDKDRLLKIKYDGKLSSLHENISNVLKNKTPQNYKLINESLINIIEQIRSKKTNNIIIENTTPPSILNSVLYNKFIEKYKDLVNIDLLEQVIFAKESERERIQLNLVSECMSIIDNKKVDADDILLIKLDEVYKKLSKLSYSDNSYYSDMGKLITLKSNLIS